MEQSQQALFIKYLNDQCTQQEILDLLSHFRLGANESNLKSAILSELKQDVLADLYTNDVANRLNNIKGQLNLHIQQSKPRDSRLSINWWIPVGIAAAMFLIVSSSVWYYLQESTGHTTEISYLSDALPGKTGATLTLANGKKIQLDDANQGKLAEESGISISKSVDGQLVYEISGDAKSTGMNTLSTHKGQTYQVKLPDGSQVWLNAASEISYTAALRDNGRRKVKLNGEAYFEISKDAAHPFVVESNGQEVEVLGTHFNIKAYGEEQTSTTTLLEGSIKLNATNEREKLRTSFVLAPGEQALNNGRVRIEEADLAEAIAWKNGNTVFKDKSLEEVMSELSRWYNVDVVYAEDAPRNELFSGAVSRARKLSAVLERMQNTGSVKFSITGNTVTVMK